MQSQTESFTFSLILKILSPDYQVHLCRDLRGQALTTGLVTYFCSNVSFLETMDAIDIFYACFGQISALIS